MTAFIFLSLGFILLIKGADFLVEAASSMARKFNVSDLVIGLTVVAFGTSTTELLVNIMSSLKGNTNIAVGNVMGSNIFNIFFVLGISSVIKPLPVNEKNNIDIGVVIISTLLLFINMFSGKRAIIDRWEGVVSLFFIFCISLFLYFSCNSF